MTQLWSGILPLEMRTILSNDGCLQAARVIGSPRILPESSGFTRNTAVSKSGTDPRQATRPSRMTTTSEEKTVLIVTHRPAAIEGLVDAGIRRP